MTPLAHRIARELTLPLKRRTVGPEMLDLMSDLHCFDMAAVWPLVEQLAATISEDLLSFGGSQGQFMFLPARRTWIEYGKIVEGRPARFGLHLEETKSRRHCVVEFAAGAGDRVSFGAGEATQILPLVTSEGLGLTREMGAKAKEGGVSIAAEIMAALAIINTPRIVGRRQHMPHRGLERKLLAARGVQGRFPLNAWTEILLDVSPPHDASSERPAEAHLTGERALHFCRAHLRVRLGRLELVRSHWRGDASLGIKRSRYKVQA